MEELLKKCMLCPRKCGADRLHGKTGVCGANARIKVARAALHFWEEPCISGTMGSGTVFFSYCPLHCVYCQNQPISSGAAGMEIETGRLTEIFLELQEQGAHNINLVTPTQYTPQILRALKNAKEQGLSVPIIYNCGGYEDVHTLAMLRGIVDVYLTDFKYMDAGIAKRYSGVPDYFCRAKEALAEMAEQAGKAVFDEDGLMQNGVVVRVLLLPGCLADAQNIVRYVYETYGDDIYLSLMSQYTPMEENARMPRELRRTVTRQEYDALVDFAIDLGVENGFVQDGEAAQESFIPHFDLTGVQKN